MFKNLSKCIVIEFLDIKNECDMDDNESQESEPKSREIAITKESTPSSSNPPPEPPSTSNNNNNKRRKMFEEYDSFEPKPCDSKSSNFSSRHNFSSSTTPTTIAAATEESLFGQIVTLSLERLQPKKRRLTRIKIEQLLYEAEFGDQWT